MSAGRSPSVQHYSSLTTLTSVHYESAGVGVFQMDNNKKFDSNNHYRLILTADNNAEKIENTDGTVPVKLVNEDHMVVYQLPDEVKSLSHEKYTTAVENSAASMQKKHGRKGIGATFLDASVAIESDNIVAHVGNLGDGFALLFQVGSEAVNITDLNPNRHTQTIFSLESKKFLSTNGCIGDNDFDDAYLAKEEDYKRLVKGEMTFDDFVKTAPRTAISHKVEATTQVIPCKGYEKAFVLVASDGALLQRPEQLGYFARRIIGMIHENSTFAQIAKMIAEESRRVGSRDDISVAFWEASEIRRGVVMVDGHNCPRGYKDPFQHVGPMQRIIEDDLEGYTPCNPVAAGIARDYVPALMHQIALLINQSLPRISGSGSPAILAKKQDPSSQQQPVQRARSLSNCAIS